MKDYSELKRIAISAGASEWTLVIHDDCEYIDGSNGEFIAAFDEPEHGEFIAAANPAAVLWLIAEVDRLNEEYDKAWRHDLNDKNNVQALAAEVISLSKDAARYRYVRNCLHRETDILVTSKKAAHAYGDLGVYSCSVLDEIIDEAILKEDNK